MIHNIVVVDGQEYKAVKEIFACSNCAFSKSAYKSCTNERANCMSRDRVDGTGVIYKPHYKLKHQ